MTYGTDTHDAASMDFDRYDAEQDRRDLEAAAHEAARADARQLVAEAIQRARRHGTKPKWPESARAAVALAWRDYVHKQLSHFKPEHDNP